MTHLALFDPKPFDGFGSALGTNLMDAALAAYLLAALMMVLLSATVLVALVVRAIRRRRFAIVRPLLVGPGIILVVVLAAFVISAASGASAGELGVGPILGALGVLAVPITAIGAGAAVRRADFSNRQVTAIAIAGLPIAVALVAELVCTIAAVAVDGAVAWAFAPVPFLVAAVLALVVLAPTATRSAFRLG